MNTVVSSHVTETDRTAMIVSAWNDQANSGRLYLMSEILSSAFGIDAEAKDGQRMAPIVGRMLAELGMKNKRMRGPQGNRHYWVK